MTFDQGLAERIRDVLREERDVTERRMFGGLCFMCAGHMALGIVGDELMVRVGPDGWPEALDRPHAREMDFTGRSMKGMVFVADEGFADDDDLREWISRATTFARSLPPRDPR